MFLLLIGSENSGSSVSIRPEVARFVQGYIQDRGCPEFSIDDLEREARNRGLIVDPREIREAYLWAVQDYQDGRAKSRP